MKPGKNEGFRNNPDRIDKLPLSWPQWTTFKPPRGFLCSQEGTSVPCLLSLLVVSDPIKFWYTTQPHWFQFTTDCVECWMKYCSFLLLFFSSIIGNYPTMKGSISQHIRRHGACIIPGLCFVSATACQAHMCTRSRVRPTHARVLRPGGRSFTLIHLNTHTSNALQNNCGQKDNHTHHKQWMEAFSRVVLFYWLLREAFFFLDCALSSWLVAKEAIHWIQTICSLCCSFLDCLQRWMKRFAFKVDRANKPSPLVIFKDLRPYETPENVLEILNL